MSAIGNSPQDDPFVALAPTEPAAVDSFESLRQRPAAPSAVAPAEAADSFVAPAVARLQGFDLLERPLLHQLAACPGLVLPCRSTVALQRSMVGQEVLVLFEGGDLQRPIIIGVMQPPALPPLPVQGPVQVQSDGQRQVIEAEREVVLRCGDASITLTRAGKVIIRGTYILSRSSGYNKIKGAAVDIN